MLPPPVSVRSRVWRSHCNTCLLAFPRAIREREAVCVLSTDVTCWHRQIVIIIIVVVIVTVMIRQDRPRNQSRQRSDHEKVSLLPVVDTQARPYMQG